MGVDITVIHCIQWLADVAISQVTLILELNKGVKWLNYPFEY
jgi:hypothetical protein